MDVFSSAAAILSGGATGVIGAIVSNVTDIFKARAQLAQLKAQWDHEAVMKDKDAAIMAQEWASRTKVATVEADQAKDVAASNAFAVSLGAQSIKYSEGKQTGPWATGFLVALDFISGLVRPLLTVYLCVLTTYIWYQVRGLLHNETISASDAMALWRTVIDTILYLTTTCVLWWFGTRNKQSQPKLR